MSDTPALDEMDRLHKLKLEKSEYYTLFPGEEKKLPVGITIPTGKKWQAVYPGLHPSPMDDEYQDIFSNLNDNGLPLRLYLVGTSRDTIPYVVFVCEYCHVYKRNLTIVYCDYFEEYKEFEPNWTIYCTHEVRFNE